MVISLGWTCKRLENLSWMRLWAITAAVNNEKHCTFGRRNPSCFCSNTDDDAWPILYFFSFECRLLINHNHQSATQQHVSLRAAAVAHIQALILMVANEVSQLNKEHYSQCCWSQPEFFLDLLTPSHLPASYEIITIPNLRVFVSCK